MRIESVRIQNFRSFQDETINFGDYACLVGPNGAGKSTVLCALNVFFREYSESATNLSKLTEEDFYNKNTDDPIEITVTFTSLTKEAQDNLRHYVRQGKLTVCARAVYDPESGHAEVQQFGKRLVIAEFSEFFEAEKDKATVPELRAIYAKIRESYKDLPATSTKQSMIDALRAYEESRPDLCSLKDSPDQFYGVSKGQNRLAPHIQWIYIPAVKDASEEQSESKTSALGKLLARTVRSKVNFSDRLSELRESVRSRYQEIIEQENHILDEIQQSIDGRIKLWSHSEASIDVRWVEDEEKAVRVEEPRAHIVVGERGFYGELGRFGHGLQRSYLIALLQELAATDTSGGPTLVLGIEEPELYQHPPQARHLARTLRQLSSDNTQVILTTHSPYFVNAEAFEQVRLVVRQSPGAPAQRIRSTTMEALGAALAPEGRRPFQPAGAMAKVHEALSSSLNEMFFCDTVVFVEGPEDEAYLQTYLTLSGLADDFRALGGHIVPVMKKSNMIKPLAVANALGLSVFSMFDADVFACPEKWSRRNRDDNRALLRLAGHEDEPDLPQQVIWKENMVVWPENLTKVIQDEIDEWNRFEEGAAVEYGHAGGLRKNPLAIGCALELAWNEGCQSASLLKVCNAVIAMVRYRSKPVEQQRPIAVAR